MPLTFDQFICRTDNFAVLVRDDATGFTASVDAPDGAAIASRLRDLGWKLDLILCTHAHGDHTAGNLTLKSATGCTIVGPVGEADRIPGLDRPVREGDVVNIGSAIFDVLDTPGHTTGHIAYWSAGERVAFVGDTLFSLGCGRIVPGMAAAMWASLSKLAALPRDTSFYCGHEYTEQNGRFAVTVEPNNLDLEARIAEVAQLRAAGKPTLPGTIGVERATNPFLRASQGRLRRAIGMEKAEPAEIFAELRRRKDAFAG